MRVVPVTSVVAAAAPVLVLRKGRVVAVRLVDSVVPVVPVLPVVPVRYDVPVASVDSVISVDSVVCVVCVVSVISVGAGLPRLALGGVLRRVPLAGISVSSRVSSVRSASSEGEGDLSRRVLARFPLCFPLGGLCLLGGLRRLGGLSSLVGRLDSRGGLLGSLRRLLGSLGDLLGSLAGLLRSVDGLEDTERLSLFSSFGVNLKGRTLMPSSGKIGGNDVTSVTSSSTS